MNFFADEGLDFPLVDLLRQKLYRVIYAAEEMPGASDDYILQKAVQENCILITKDKDFGEMVIRRNILSIGVVLIRIEKLNLPENCLLVANFIAKYEPELSNSFTVIQEDKIRIRKL